eukprot:scaffold16355_cov170-Amphora_coffeaeformis.AAC.9
MSSIRAVCLLFLCIRGRFFVVSDDRVYVAIHERTGPESRGTNSQCAFCELSFSDENNTDIYENVQTLYGEQIW